MRRRLLKLALIVILAEIVLVATMVVYGLADGFVWIGGIVFLAGVLVALTTVRYLYCRRCLLRWYGRMK